MTLDWLYAGSPLSTRRQASACTVRRVYALERGGGLNPRGAYRGAGSGGEVAWQDGLDQTDAAAVLALVDACKRAGDRPICVVPHAAHPEEAAVCRIASDEIEVSSESPWFKTPLGVRLRVHQGSGSALGSPPAARDIPPRACDPANSSATARAAE
jgi:hypothetical protein